VPTFPTNLDLTTEGFRLRRLVPRDIAALARLRQDKETRRWAYPAGSTEADAEAAIAAADQMWASGEAAECAIVSLDGTLLGTIALKFYGPARASLAYNLAPEARGHGIATHAVTLISVGVQDIRRPRPTGAVDPARQRAVVPRGRASRFPA